MNIQKTPGTNQILSLPLYAVSPATPSRVPQNVIKSERFIEQVTLDRYYVMSTDPIGTYAPNGETVTMQKNLVGSRVDIRA